MIILKNWKKANQGKSVYIYRKFLISRTIIAIFFRNVFLVSLLFINLTLYIELFFVKQIQSIAQTDLVIKPKSQPRDQRANQMNS